MKKSTMLSLSDEFFGAIERCDMGKVRSIYAPDALIWHNFDALEARLDRHLSQSVDDNVALLAALPGFIRNLKYKVWHEAETCNGFVRQHVINGMTDTGEAVAFPVCVITEVLHGRIVALYEYLNVSHLPAAVINYFSKTTNQSNHPVKEL